MCLCFVRGFNVCREEESVRVDEILRENQALKRQVEELQMASVSLSLLFSSSWHQQERQDRECEEMREKMEDMQDGVKSLSENGQVQVQLRTELVQTRVAL